MTTQTSATASASAPTAPPLLVIDSVRRSFGNVLAVDGVSLEVMENEFFALLGPSGCGKTTLLRILAGFEHPDEGTVTLRGDDLLRHPPNRRPVNLMFQSYALFPHMSVERNVAYGLERDGVAKDEVRRRVGEVLDTVGLAELAGRRPRQLSGGQRQRVALARAIVKRPQLLLLDEPLSALDKKVRAEMQRELKRLQHEVGITFAVVTHDQEEAMSMADRIAVMHEGRVQQVAPPVTLYRRPETLFVADFIGTSNVFSGRRTENGLEVVGLGELPGHGDIPVGDHCHLVVRPEDIGLTPATPSEPGSATDLVGGTVIDVQFFGGASTVAVRVPGQADPLLVGLSGVSTVRVGDEVSLTWTGERAVLLP